MNIRKRMEDYQRKSWSRQEISIFIVVIISLAVSSDLVESQSRSPNGLQRSFSDSRLDRNRNNYHRQHSFSRNDHCSTNYKFDYIQLTLMWAPGACSTNPQECKREVNTHFTVHGLWPTIKNTREPSNCCFDNSFDYNAIQPILPLLNEWWYSYEGSNRGFWTHEWLKHGTCSRDVPSLRGEARYFNTTVQLAQQLPILEALLKSGIKPDNQKVIQSSDLTKALAPLAQGKYLSIDCDYEHNQPIPVLTGLNFCYDSNLRPSDCPEMKRKCQRQIIIPYTSRSRSPNSLFG